MPPYRRQPNGEVCELGSCSSRDPCTDRKPAAAGTGHWCRL